MHGRDEERVETTVREIRKETNNDKLRCYRADFSSLGEVRRLAEEVRTNHAHLDALVNNAGVFVRERAVSRDGHELTFAVNFLALFLLPTFSNRCYVAPRPRAWSTLLRRAKAQ